MTIAAKEVVSKLIASSITSAADIEAVESGAVPTEPESSNHADVIGGKLQHSRRRGGNKLVETLVAMAGNVLEWYDFAVFGAFSDIIGKVFFRPQAGHKATAESFLVFWAAFMARPFGGMLLGYIGDTRGRKKALEISMFLMAISTFALGCLPSYARVGGASTALLIIVRMAQGLQALVGSWYRRLSIL